MKIILSLVAIFLASVSAVGYLYAEEVQKAHDPKNPIKVICFQKLAYSKIRTSEGVKEFFDEAYSFWICPDPSEFIEIMAYHKGVWSGGYKEHIYRVSKDFFNDPRNWEYLPKRFIRTTDPN